MPKSVVLESSGLGSALWICDNSTVLGNCATWSRWAGVAGGQGPCRIVPQSSILIWLLLLNFSYVVNTKTPASTLLYTVEALGHGKLIHVTALISACLLMTEVNPAALVCSAPPPTNLTHSTCQPATNQVRQCGTLELFSFSSLYFFSCVHFFHLLSLYMIYF